MKIRILFAAMTLACIVVSNHSCEAQKGKGRSTCSFVNPFIGTGADGHTYPGAQSPFGMVQLSPDNGRSGWSWVSGYHYSDSIIVGFSHTHLSGAGIGDLQDISVMPTMADFDTGKQYKQNSEVPYRGYYTHKDEVASPGYYSVNLKNSGIKVELTATPRTGFHRYTFSKKGARNVALDLGYAQNWDAPTETEVEYVNDRTIKGKRFSTGWAKDQQVYFYMEFSEPMVAVNAAGGKDLKAEKRISGKGVKVLMKFKSDVGMLMVKVAISAVSEENAFKNLQAENSRWSFDAVRLATRQAWEKELSEVVVEGDDPIKKEIFYTALYHAKQAPTLFTDINGEYRGADIKVHKANGYQYYTGLSLWDTFRTHNPLMTILRPDLESSLANTMLAHFDETGILPVWVLSGNETNTMTGYHSVSMLAEAVMKGIGGFDYERAYKAMKATMLQDHRGLKEMLKYGYVPYDLLDESVTISLELAYNYYGTAMVAKKLGHTDDYSLFLEKSLAYKHLFDKSTGFMRGKDSKGAWRPDFDPKHSSHRVKTDYTEGNAWQHSWFVLHDVKGLIDLFGGDSAFEKHLTRLFNESSEITGENVSPDISGLIGQYAHGNEPSHHIAYLYNYAGEPWKTQEMVHRILTTMYSNAPDGISGNEDMGQMSAWYVMSAMGFYPVNPVDGNFVIGTPLFKSCQINLRNGKAFKVLAKNVSDKNYYIQKVRLNGKPLERSYISYKEITGGGTLEFEMGNTPNKAWATSIEFRPPSLSK